MSKLNLPPAFICHHHSAKISSLIAFCLLFVISISCNNSGKNDGNNQDSTKSAPAKEDSIEANVISNKLYVLYLQNAQIKDLIGETPRNNKSVVFTFYRDRAGHLGLAAWPTTKGSREYQTGKVIRLSRHKESGETIYNKDVYLGDLQLGKNAVEKLRSVINKEGFEYIIFKPISDTDNKYKNHLVYKIVGAPNLDNNVLMMDITTTNPSPPRNNDEEY